MTGIILLLVGGGLIYLAYIITQAKKERAKIYQQEGQEYIARASDTKSVPEIKTDIFLQKNEKAILESENSYLQETRAVRKTSGGGAGIRVAKGVTVGKFASTSHSQQQLKVIDQGVLTITNKRIIFTGSEETRDIPISKIAKAVLTGKNLEINATNRKKSMIFSVSGNPVVWNFVLEIIARGDDPLDLSS
jgi:hypothetical protein